MSARSVLAALLVSMVCVATGAGERQSQAPAQTFRTGTDVVLVDVSVRDGGQPVTGLRAADFELTDNGVRQRIDSVETTAVPVDVTVVADLSGNPRRPPETLLAPDEAIANLQGQVDRIAALLRPDDRVRVFGVDESVQLVVPFVAPGSVPRIDRLQFDGRAALYDTLTAALLYQVTPARRHVIIAGTRGHDGLSSIDRTAVRALAEKADALVHLVLLESARDREEELNGFQCRNMGYCWPTRRFWTPLRRTLFARLPGDALGYGLIEEGRIIAAGVESTGGVVHQSGAFSAPSLSGAVKATLDRFRSGYLLRYTLQGVARAGWHAVSVRVPGHRSYAVQSRKGYGLEDPPAANKPLAAPEALQRIDDYVAAYGRNEYAKVALGFRATKDIDRLVRDFEEGGNPWPAAPRREAVFVLDLVEQGLFSRDTDSHARAVALLERFTRLVRPPLEPDAFELYWHFAALTMLEGTLRPGEAGAFVERALQRFPSQSRFLLSRAIVADQRLRVAAAARGTGEVNEVLGLYSAAMTLPDTEAEARIRSAWVLHGVGRDEEARSQLVAAAAKPIEERALRYLRQLFMGHVLVALRRNDDGIAAFRAALEEWPAAQSARVALMNVLLVAGQQAEAEKLADQVQTERGDGVDPWWTYWQGQYRMHGLVMVRLQGMLAQ